MSKALGALKPFVHRASTRPLALIRFYRFLSSYEAVFYQSLGYLFDSISQERCNFIEVDWSAGSVDPNYFTAKASAQQAGRDVASFVHWLHQYFDLPYSNVHIIGHSLGGQAAGAAGRMIQNPKIARISGNLSKCSV